jgi:hypothetical protein
MTTYTLFSQATETVSSSGAGANGTNGLHFTVSSACTLNGIWHYSPSGFSQTQLPTTIGLYNYSTHALIHSETVSSWSGAAGSGWVLASFSSPPSLVSGTDYMAVQFRNDAVNGWFVYTDPYTWPVTSGILTAPDDVPTGQGWYNIGTALAYPATQNAGYNWWMDVSVSTSSSITSTGAMSFNAAIASSGTVAGPYTSTGAMAFTPAVSASGLVPFTATGAMSFSPAIAGTGQFIAPVTMTGAMSFNAVIAGTGKVPFTSTGALSFRPAVAATGSVNGPYTSTGALAFHPGIAGSGVAANPVTGTAALAFNAAISGHASSAITSTGAMSFSPAIAGTSRTTRLLLMSMAPVAGTDEYGNNYLAGFHLYDGSGNILSLQNNGSYGSNPTMSFTPSSVTNLTANTTSFGFASNPGASNQQTWLVHSSGKTNSKADAAIQLLGESGDGTLPPTTTFEYGGTIYQQFTNADATFYTPVYLAQFTNYDITSQPIIASELLSSGSSSEYLYTYISTGKENNQADAAIQLFSQNAAGTRTPEIALEFGGTQALSVTPSQMTMSVPIEAGTWQNLTLYNSWTLTSGGIAQCKLMPDNTVMVRLVNVTPGTVTNGTIFTELPYTPVTEMKIPVIMEYTTAPTSIDSMPYIYVSGTALEVYNMEGTVKWIHTLATIPLD